jgi:two-component system nitrate/nitrite response regulator NarP
MTSQLRRKSSTVRVGIADKSPLVRAGLQHLFENDERFDLVTVCNDGKSFLASLDGQPLDVAISGWVIEPSRGKYILDQLRSRPDAPRVIIYTGADDENIPVLAMAHGAAAFVSKREETEYLLDTVASVAAGHMVFPFVDVRRLHLNPLTTLTHREMEVLAAAATGQTTKDIAAAQGVTANTVKFHLRNVYEKLGVSNRSQAIAIYLKS